MDFDELLRNYDDTPAKCIDTMGVGNACLKDTDMDYDGDVISVKRPSARDLINRTRSVTKSNPNGNSYVNKADLDRFINGMMHLFRPLQCDIGMPYYNVGGLYDDLVRDDERSSQCEDHETDDIDPRAIAIALKELESHQR